MAQPKKTSTLSEWFYIALLLTAIRPPDHHQLSSLLPYRRSLLTNHQFGIDDHHHNNNGPLSVENFYYNDDIHSFHLNGISHDQHFNTKSSILLSETLDVLDDLNSLGRYSNIPNYPNNNNHHNHHNSNLIAFPVSGGFSSNVFIKQEQDDNHLSSSNVNLNSNNSDENSSLSIDPDILQQIDFELQNFPFNNNDDTIWPNLNDGMSFFKLFALI
ncbi:hypothetical protein BLA29_007837 [Euroglyphus maynei]|uniref:Uncharacterized protein n=1 Tax=Euroglyphus maynei TaxID=6958 RepID=A0A1Y3AYD8_EURMA|nr:hypothetical protein BLA29_007837 [Euroglyphus maynei]